jgi:hypothetical protein
MRRDAGNGLHLDARAERIDRLVEADVLLARRVAIRTRRSAASSARTRPAMNVIGVPATKLAIEGMRGATSVTMVSCSRTRSKNRSEMLTNAMRRPHLRRPSRSAAISPA